jgi:endonuclease/exonuclease/phosphatase family metal-dependent hydrolase
LHRKSNQVVRVMTYNIHRWTGHDQRIDIERLAGVISSVRADVIGLNEVLHPVIMAGQTREVLAELAKYLNMHYAFGPSGWIDSGPGWSGPVGNALLSKYKLDHVANTLLPRAFKSKQRSLLGARLAEGPAQGMQAYVTHLDHAFEGTRLMQLAGVLRKVSQPGPHFLCGDFNTPGFLGRHTRRLLPPVLRRLQGAGYQDAFHAVGQGCGRTFPSTRPLFRIDFLFFPQRWAHGLHSARTLAVDKGYDASDHLPVVAEWSWPDMPAHVAV